LIVVVVAGIITILNEKNFYYASIRIGLSILAAISALSAILAMANLKHESRLLFLEELQIFKIAKLMKLDCTVPDNFRWLPNDKYFLSQKWRDTKYGTSGRLGNTPEDWVIARLRGHGFFGTITCLFITEIIASIILIITIWSI